MKGRWYGWDIGDGMGLLTRGAEGSPIWHLIYSFPPYMPGQIANGYKEFAKTWKPIIGV